MPAAPRISVVIDTYQQDAFLARAVESALEQTAPFRCEVIVVDDGSADGTIPLLAGFGERVRVIRQENAGQGAALNTGVAAATGELVAFLDGDDAWAPGYLARVDEAFAADLTVDSLFSPVQRVDEEGAPLEPDPPDAVVAQLARLQSSPEAAREGRFPWFPPTSAIAARTDTLRALGPIPTAYRVNADGWLQLALVIAARSLRWQSERLVHLRIHGQNRWSGDRDDDPVVATRRRELYERMARDVAPLAARFGRDASGLERALRAQAEEFAIWEHILLGRRAEALAAALRWQPPPWMERPSERAFKRFHTLLGTVTPVEAYAALRAAWRGSAFARVLRNGGVP